MSFVHQMEDALADTRGYREIGKHVHRCKDCNYQRTHTHKCRERHETIIEVKPGRKTSHKCRHCDNVCDFVHSCFGYAINGRERFARSVFSQHVHPCTECGHRCNHSHMCYTYGEPEVFGPKHHTHTCRDCGDICSHSHSCTLLEFITTLPRWLSRWK